MVFKQPQDRNFPVDVCGSVSSLLLFWFHSGKLGRFDKQTRLQMKFEIAAWAQTADQQKKEGWGWQRGRVV
jgi:hypothetical protein